MNPFRKLLGDTAIYGVSSIVGRFFNWWLMPYHTNIFNPEVYGVVSNLYSYVAFALILLTYGMETGFFRFASKSENPDKVYSTSLISLFASTLLFIALFGIFREDVATALQYEGHAEYLWWLALTVGLDAFTAIPFAQLRLKGRPIKFAVIKMVNISVNIAFNLFFLSVCPWIAKNYPEIPIQLIYNPSVGVGYVFLANLLSSVVTLLLLYREIVFVHLSFEFKLLREMLAYSFPILVIGLAGMINQNIDKVLMPFLIPEEQNPMFQLGIYGANYKLAVLMNMFIQAFRYAFEPFFFGRSGKGSPDDPRIYATVMKYFVLFGWIIFLGMILYIDIIKLLVPMKYHPGLKVVPLILLSNLFFGVFFSASIWFKLKDKTWYGAVIALIGAVITLGLNILLVPVMGYMGSAWAVLICFTVMMLINYFWGQKHYPIPYDLKRIGLHSAAALTIFGLTFITRTFSPVGELLLNTLMMAVFFLFLLWIEKEELMKILKRKKG